MNVWSTMAGVALTSHVSTITVHFSVAAALLAIEGSIKVAVNLSVAVQQLFYIPIESSRILARDPTASHVYLSVTPATVKSAIPFVMQTELSTAEDVKQTSVQQVSLYPIPTAMTSIDVRVIPVTTVK